MLLGGGHCCFSSRCRGWLCCCLNGWKCLVFLTVDCFVDSLFCWLSSRKLRLLAALRMTPPKSRLAALDKTPPKSPRGGRRCQRGQDVRPPYSFDGAEVVSAALVVACTAFVQCVVAAAAHTLLQHTCCCCLGINRSAAVYLCHRLGAKRSHRLGAKLATGSGPNVATGSGPNVATVQPGRTQLPQLWPTLSPLPIHNIRLHSPLAHENPPPSPIH